MLQEIASITGHSLRSAAQILEVYLCRTDALSDHATGQLEARGANILSNGLSGNSPKCQIAK